MAVGLGACAVRDGNVMLEAQPAGSRSEFALTRVACVRTNQRQSSKTSIYCIISSRFQKEGDMALASARDPPPAAARVDEAAQRHPQAPPSARGAGSAPG